jgi:hypothetical protein
MFFYAKYIYVHASWTIIFVVLGIQILLSLSRVIDEYHHLIIDDHYIYELKKYKHGQKFIKILEHPRSQIDILAYNPGYTFDKCLDTKGNLIKGSSITILPKLYLYFGEFEYSFTAQFSKAELWWLGQELSDFLNLELQIIYPTPKVPPAPSCGGGC